MKKFKCDSEYYSGLAGTYCDPVLTTFTLTKKTECRTIEEFDVIIERLDRLKNENFNRVLIPKFDYTIEDNKIIQNIEFIKGYTVATFHPKYSKILYEDVVRRKSDWTFTDFSFMNFIVHKVTHQIYAVDFLSFEYCPSMDYREKKWQMKLKEDYENWKIGNG